MSTIIFVLAVWMQSHNHSSLQHSAIASWLLWNSVECEEHGCVKLKPVYLWAHNWWGALERLWTRDSKMKWVERAVRRTPRALHTTAVEFLQNLLMAGVRNVCSGVAHVFWLFSGIEVPFFFLGWIMKHLIRVRKYEGAHSQSVNSRLVNNISSCVDCWTNFHLSLSLFFLLQALYNSIKNEKLEWAMYVPVFVFWHSGYYTTKYVSNKTQ